MTTDRPLIALAAGGSGGHVFPAQAVADALRAHGFEPLLLTDSRGAVFAEPIPDLAFEVLPAATIKGGLLEKLGAARTIGMATLRAAATLRKRRAKAVIGFGGYPSFAPSLAAKLTGIPLVLHEQATTFSLANRKLLPLASRIALSFPINDPVAQESRTVRTGPAVRAAIADVAQSPYPPMDGPIELLVVGGSQSAAVFGTAVPEALLRLPDSLRPRIRLSLQYKGDEGEAIVARLAAAGIHAEIAPFFHDMAQRLVRAHLVITRSGASTAADMTAVGRPAIFVPIPVGGSVGEQCRNAQALAATGMGWYLPQDELEKGALVDLLPRLLIGDILPGAARASAALGEANGAEMVARLIESLLAKG